MIIDFLKSILLILFYVESVNPIPIANIIKNYESYVN